jgi:putative CocE/NonD family hydrolase
VHPDGAARFLCHGALRARFRDGFEKAVFLEPDVVTRFEIDMTCTGVRFLPGHRIRVEIASSWFSRFDRNPQTDAANWMTDTRAPVVAQQRIYHDRERPSHVLLPLIPVAPRRS